MFYKFFKSCADINFFIEKRLIEKEKEQPKGVPLFAIKTTLAKPDESLQYKDAESEDARKAREKAEREKREAEARAKAKRDKLRSGLPNPTEVANEDNKGKDKPRTVKEGLHRTRKRLEKELFDKKSLEEYIKDLKDAIEKLGADKLHKFIKDHSAYGGDFKKWNSDLVDTFELTLTEGEDEEREHMRYAAALQIFLADHFAAQKKADVFQTLKGKMANPFIYIDGKLGGYTISALGAYWNGKYLKDKNKNKTNLPKLEYANLEKEYGDRPKNRENFGKAIDYLKAKLGDQPAVANPSAPTTAPGQSPTATPVAAPGTTPATPKTPKANEKTPPQPAQPEIKLTEVQKKNASSMVYLSTIGTEAFLTVLPSLKDYYHKQLDNLKELESKAYDPSVWFLKFKERKTSWPARVFTEYEALYEKTAGGRTEKAADPMIVNKFKELRWAVEEYYKQVDKMQNSLKQQFQKRAESFMTEYELPDQVGSCFLGENGLIEDRIRDFSLQAREIRLEYLQRPEEIDKLYKAYFKSGFSPKKTPQKLDDLIPYLRGNSKEEKARIRQTIIDQLGRGNEQEALRQLREIIKFRNMYYLRDHSIQMEKDMDWDMKRAIDLIDNNMTRFLELRGKNNENQFTESILKDLYSPKSK